MEGIWDDKTGSIRINDNNATLEGIYWKKIGWKEDTYDVECIGDVKKINLEDQKGKKTLVIVPDMSHGPDDGKVLLVNSQVNGETKESHRFYLRNC